MTDKIPTANRRNVIKALGGGAAAAGLGGAALLASTGAATAASVSISGTSVTLDDGDVSYVDLTVDDYTASWDGFDVPVVAVAYRDVLESADGSTSHVLFNQKGVDQQPIKLSEMSSNGGTDGWGGSDEYATVSGPSTAGAVHAGVDWRILSSDGTGAKSIEDPADTDTFGLDVATDDTKEETRLKLRKQVWFYRKATSDDTNTLMTQDGNTEVALMGTQDGTKEKAEAVAEFGVTVKNQASTSGTSGSGTTNAG